MGTPPPTRTRPARAITVLVALALAATACRADVDARPLVLVASSVGPAFEAMVDAGFEIQVSAAGSQVLAAQVRAGVPADLLVLADPDLAQALHDEGLAGPPARLAHNGLALLARFPGADLSDLSDPGRTVVLADPAVPLGRYTNDLLTEQAITAAPDSLEDNARSVALKVLTGAADLAVVYRSDAATALREDPSLHATDIGRSRVAVVTIQVLASARAEHLDLRIRSIRGKFGIPILRKYGFDV